MDKGVRLSDPQRTIQVFEKRRRTAKSVRRSRKRLKDNNNVMQKATGANRALVDAANESNAPESDDSEAERNARAAVAGVIAAYEFMTPTNVEERWGDAIITCVTMAAGFTTKATASS